MKTTSILTAVLLGLGTAGALAQEDGQRPGGPGGPRGQGGPGGERPSPQEMFKRLDKNSDGKISKDEAPERMKENFDKFDKNSDGVLTADELKRPEGKGGPGGPGGPRGDGEAGPRGPRGDGQGGPGGDRPDPAEMFKRLDKNADGKITKDEAPERMAEHFDKLDKNGDGALTPDELKRPEGAGPRGPRGDGEGGPGPRGPRPDGGQI